MGAEESEGKRNLPKKLKSVAGGVCERKERKRKCQIRPKSVAPLGAEESEGKRNLPKKLKSVAGGICEPESGKRNHGKVKNLLTFCLKTLAK